MKELWDFIDAGERAHREESPVRSRSAYSDQPHDQGPLLERGDESATYEARTGRADAIGSDGSLAQPSTKIDEKQGAYFVEQCPHCGLNLGVGPRPGFFYCNHCQREWSDEEIAEAKMRGLDANRIFGGLAYSPPTPKRTAGSIWDEPAESDYYDLRTAKEYGL